MSDRNTQQPLRDLRQDRPGTQELDEPVSGLAAEAADVASAAVEYARLGWRGLPIPPGSKGPTMKQWPERASADPEQLRALFKARPDWNLAIATGAASGLLVLDVDGDPGQLLPGRELPPTPTARTGGGGRHFYFAWTSELDGVSSTRVGLQDHVDTRGEGGCVVAPPSVHPSGSHYSWLPGRSPVEVSPVRPPRWLMDLLRGGRRTTATPTQEWREIARDGATEGARNATLARFAGHLFRRVDAEVAAELLLAWTQARCSPPMNEAEAVRTIESIAAKERKRRQGDSWAR